MKMKDTSKPMSIVKKKAQWLLAQDHNTVIQGSNTSKSKIIFNTDIPPAANKGFSAMLASEYILIDISLISCSPSFTNITELWNIPSAFYL